MPTGETGISDAVERFIADLRRRNRSPRTVKDYHYTLRRYAQQFGRVDDEHVLRFLAPYTKPATQNKLLAQIQSFTKWYGREDELVGELRLGPASVPDAMPTVLNHERIASLLALMRRESPPAWAVVTLLRDTGMRFHEVLALGRDNLEFVGEPSFPVVKFYGKRKKERVVPLTDEAFDAFMLWANLAVKPSSWAIRRAMQRAERRLGLEHMKPKDFRSTVASRLINEEQVEYEVVAELLGHSNTDILRARYARLNAQRLKTLIVDRIKW